jgi:hypothetical protein
MDAEVGGLVVGGGEGRGRGMQKRLIVLMMVAGLMPVRAGLRLAVFDSDATPPVGTQMSYDPMLGVGKLSLRCRGVVLTGSGEPVVLATVDWIGVANDGHDYFRAALAKAAGTVPERVALHALHQHDAPLCDFGSERLLREAGRPVGPFEGGVQRELIGRAAGVVEAAMKRAEPVTHAGSGEAEVRQVASNRRIMGEDGKVRATRYTACRDAGLRNEPEGVIDAKVRVVGFWNGDRVLAVLSYYATHPQSYYRTGMADPDFPGIARFLREQTVPALHVHFTGAGGNIGAGKYNDGSPEMRAVLATRLEDGMARAWEAVEKEPVSEAEVSWRVERVALPVAKHLEAGKLRESLRSGPPAAILGSAMQLAWLERCEAGYRVEVSCLALGKTRLLHMPGELFVEYQLAAARMHPGGRVGLAAYGDYGPGYIGTAAAYPEGGYETQPTSSFVDPGVEAVLMGAMGRVLGGE